MRLQGKSAIITGSYRGIGKATAMLFAQEGADVLVNARNEDDLKSVYEEIKKVGKGKVCAFKGDVSFKNQVDNMFDMAMKEFGKVDILVNNAAVVWRKHFLEYSEEFWDEVMRIDLKSVFLTSHLVSRIMAKNMGGSIINLSSIGATKSHRENVGYDTSKGAIEAMTRALAVELGAWNIRVNAISPAVVLGAHVRKLPEEILNSKDPANFSTPLLKQGTPEDVASLALFLASEESGFITGQVIAIDGGLGIQARPFKNSPESVTPLNAHEKGII